jgi:hypothetical protein
LAHFQRIIELFTQKIVTKLSNIWVWDPGSGKNLFRIPAPGVKNRIQDTQHWAKATPPPLHSAYPVAGWGLSAHAHQADRMARYKLLWIAILGLTSFLYLAVSVSKFR